MEIGYIRATNKRANMGPKPVTGEMVMDGHRGPGNVFGNPYILHNHNDNDERTKVIALHKADFEKDWESQGPMFDEVQRLAKLVATGSKIAIQCYCKPRNCHLDHVISRINKVVKETTGMEPVDPFAIKETKQLSLFPDTQAVSTLNKLLKLKAK
jgi:hypothetical protein